MWGTIRVHSGASASASKLTVPIITAISITVPGCGSSDISPESGGRRQSRSSRRSKIESLEKRLR